MAEVLQDFPVKASKAERFLPYFDGQVWKLSPAEFDLDDDTKALRSRVASAAKRLGLRVRSCVTFDGHVVVQKIEANAPLTPQEEAMKKARATKKNAQSRTEEDPEK